MTNGISIIVLKMLMTTTNAMLLCISLSGDRFIDVSKNADKLQKYAYPFFSIII